MTEKNTRIIQLFITSIIALLLVVCGGGNTDGGSGVATLTWTPPTTNEDGTPLVDLAGYKIYYGTASRSYPNSITIANPGITSYVIDNLASGTYYFAATAFNYSGGESDVSNEVSKVIN